MRSHRKFTAIELTSIVILLAVTAFVISAQITQSIRKARRISCVGHLKNIGLSFRIWATDNNDNFPSVYYVTNQTALSNLTISTYFKHLSNELSTPLILHCPADRERKKATQFERLEDRNVSYFSSLSASENRPQDWLAGDRNLLVNGTIRSGLIPLDRANHVSWSKTLHRYQGTLTMGDGSVQQLSSDRLGTNVVETNLLLFPESPHN